MLNHENVISDLNEIKKRQSDIGESLTIKWKVALKNNHEEEASLEEILSQIGNNIMLRIDANGSWGREIANRWADILKDNKNICLLYTSPSPRDNRTSRMPSSA